MFQRPRRIEWEELGPQFGRLVAEPFEKGYALTVGNSLRRVLLSVIPGDAISWVRIDGAGPEAVRVPGVREDLSALLLNVKGFVVRRHEAMPATLRLDVKGPREVTAGDLAGSDAEVLTPKAPLCTLDAGGRLKAEFGVRRGRGYVPAGRQGDGVQAGAIPLDAAYSPIRRVNYLVEMSRLGNITDYEKLVVEVETNGAISPDHALLRAAQVLREHFDLFTPAGAEEEDDESPSAPAAAGEASNGS